MPRLSDIESWLQTDEMPEEKIKKNILLNIIRETGYMRDTKANWLNRYVEDPETKVYSVPWTPQ